MSANPSTVVGRSEIALAKYRLPVIAPRARAVVATVQIQQAATVIVYRVSCPPTGAARAPKTHRRFRQKCSVTASRYATATAAKPGQTVEKSQIIAKSNTATSPPTTQKRNKLPKGGRMVFQACPEAAIKGNSLVILQVDPLFLPFV